MLRRLLLAAVLLAAAPAAAHEVQHHVERGEAVIVTLEYADGVPLAYEEVEVRAEGEDQPILLGKTDVEGRIAFVPDSGTSYVVRAFAQDGHGAQVRVAASDGEAEMAPVSSSAGGTGGVGRILLGVVLILGLFLGLRRIVARDGASPQRISQG
ncbi:MAG TPA: ABC transporter permease [Candidatus Krumholzibacteria bacterium]|nr:ABC transporter permease [Candidatus Krumholzibacteria bacterium]